MVPTGFGSRICSGRTIISRPSDGPTLSRLYCCGIADTVKTKFKVEPGDGKHPDDRWYAWLKEEWVAIPAEKTVPDFAPDGLHLQDLWVHDPHA